MMADLKEHGSVASVLTMAVSEMVQRRDEVVERRLSFQKERFLSQCSGKVEEQRTLKEVERRFSTLVDEALRGERNKANLRQFGTNLLKLRVDMDKQIMSLMMQPEETERGVCEILEEYSEDLGGRKVCSSNERANEVAFEPSAAADDGCFSNIAFSYNLDQLLEKTETESERVLTNNMGSFNQKIIQQLEQLEEVHQRIEHLRKIQGLLSLQVDTFIHERCQ